MGSIDHKIHPEKLTLGKYLGVGKFGGFVFSVITGYTEDYQSNGVIEEPMVLLNYKEYQGLTEWNRRTQNIGEKECCEQEEE
jgi:hypothetical protein